MKRHSDKKAKAVFDAVLSAVGNNMTRFEAADCAVKILHRHSGNVEQAIQDAKNPFRIHGRFCY